MGLTTDGYAICEILSCINLKSLWSIVKNWGVRKDVKKKPFQKVVVRSMSQEWYSLQDGFECKFFGGFKSKVRGRLEIIMKRFWSLSKKKL